MQLKLDENGVPVLENGHPVYVNADGKDIVVDVPKLFTDLKVKNKENADRRGELATLTEKLKAFEGIEDPEAARAALVTVANLDDKQLVDAKKMDELKANMAAAHTAQLAQLKQGYEVKLADAAKVVSAKDANIRSLLVKGAFDASQFLAEKTVTPPDMAFATFGHHFEVEEVDGKLRAVAKLHGSVIPSLANPGEPASPEEAIQVLIDSYPFKDRILKAPAASGSGAAGGGGGGAGAAGGQFTISRANAQDHQQYKRLAAEAAKAGQVVQIID